MSSTPHSIRFYHFFRFARANRVAAFKHARAPPAILSSNAANRFRIRGNPKGRGCLKPQEGPENNARFDQEAGASGAGECTRAAERPAGAEYDSGRHEDSE